MIFTSHLTQVPTKKYRDGNEPPPFHKRPWLRGSRRGLHVLQRRDTVRAKISPSAPKAERGALETWPNLSPLDPVADLSLIVDLTAATDGTELWNQQWLTAISEPGHAPIRP